LYNLLRHIAFYVEITLLLNWCFYYNL